jgi:hypothetical protein
VPKGCVECLSHRECRCAGGTAHRGRAVARLLVIGEFNELESMKKACCLSVSVCVSDKTSTPSSLSA